MKESAWGFAYGCVLAFITGMAAGSGHGLYFPMGIVSAPLSLVGIRTAMFGLPVLWGTFGFLIARDSQVYHNCCGVLLITSYVGAALAGKVSTDFGDYQRWPEMPDSVRMLSVAALLLYCGGQIVISWQLARFQHRGLVK